ncbi:MAG: branched-chain amino acid aminotransferase [Oscillospiraceae bacterium]|nr:branched-chain amino acid aminotransferase [Oscillospiraceae bacterium]
MKYNFEINLTQNPKPKPDPDTLKFGKTFTDHMFVMEYTADKGWHDGKIVPYGPITLEPSSSVLHYAQTAFEGMKAYRTADGRHLLFRPYMNAARVNKTNDRMCMPEMDEELFVEAVKALVEVDKDWIPTKSGTSLYIRPFMFANETFIGVAPAEIFKFIIICSPVGPYYDTPGGGLLAASIYVEEELVRAVVGGTGFAKVGGNYAGSMKAQKRAKQHGCEQVLWLDAIEHSYVEEIGTSNAFFMIGDEVITAPLLGTILPGVTRASVIELLQKWGIKISERRLRIEDVVQASKDGSLKEIFATGTAAVISPVGKLQYRGAQITIGDGGIGALTQKLYDTLYGLQTGSVPDDMGWTMEF